jgi:hypothetical protein
MPTVTIAQQRISDLQSDLRQADQKLKELEREEDRRKAIEDAEYHALIAKKALELRDALTAILDVFPLLKDAENDWRRNVFCGTATADQEEEQTFYTVYAVWNAIALRRAKIAERAAYFGRHGSTENFDPLLDRLLKIGEEAKAVLQNWETPVISSSPSFRTPPLSAEASVRLRDILGSGK